MAFSLKLHSQDCFCSGSFFFFYYYYGGTTKAPQGIDTFTKGNYCQRTFENSSLTGVKDNLPDSKHSNNYTKLNTKKNITIAVVSNFCANHDKIDDNCGFFERVA